MSFVKINEQKQYFDKRKNQYKDELLLYPKCHVKNELNIFINKLRTSLEIVDFGSGNGRLAIPLLQINKKIIAVDISNLSLKRLVKNAKKINKDKNLTVCHDIRKVKEVQKIIGADILHHIDQSIYLPFIFKSLKSGGSILFSEPNSWHIFWWIFILSKMNWNIEKGIVQCSYFKLIKQLQQAGFKHIYLQGFGFFPPPLFNCCSFLARINYWLGDLPLLKCFAFRFIIEARKE